MLDANKTCKPHPINIKNHAKTSLTGNHYVNKWGMHIVWFLQYSTVRQALDMKMAKGDQVVYGPKGVCRTNIGHLK